MDLVVDADAVREGRADKPARHALFETARFFLDVHVLRPGQAAAPHVHEGADKVYVVLSGRGSVRTGDATHDVRAGHAVLCRAGEPHGVEARGPEDLRLLVFMAPHPRPPAPPGPVARPGAAP